MGGNGKKSASEKAGQEVGPLNLSWALRDKASGLRQKRLGNWRNSPIEVWVVARRAWTSSSTTEKEPVRRVENSEGYAPANRGRHEEGEKKRGKTLFNSLGAAAN